MLVTQKPNTIGPGISAATDIFGKLIGQKAAASKEKEYGNILGSVFAELEEGAGPEQYQGALAKAISQGVPFKQAMDYGTMYSNLLKAQPKPEKEQIPAQTRDRVERAFNRYEELLKTGSGLGFFGYNPMKLFAKGRQDVAEFKTLSGVIESALMPLVNKGTLARERFKYILSLIPDPDETAATARGKMNALKLEFGKAQEDAAEKEKRSSPKQDTSQDTGTFQKPTVAIAKANPGKIIVNKETGQELISKNGKWIQYKGK